MKKIILLILLLMVFFAQGQQVLSSVKNDEPLLVFDQKDFGEKFIVLATEDEEYDYYVVNLEKLPSDFERIYFLNQSYSYKKLISIDSDLRKEQLWFKAYHEYSEDDISCIFTELLDKTKEADSAMTEAMKSAWMAKFDKFNKK